MAEGHRRLKFEDRAATNAAKLAGASHAGRSFSENGQYLGVSAAGCDGRMKNQRRLIRLTLVLSAIGANCGSMFFPASEFTAIKNTITIKPHSERLESLYLFHLLSKSTFPKRGGGQPFIAKGGCCRTPNPPAAAGGAEGDRGGDRGLPESHRRRPRRPRQLPPPHPHPPRLADGRIGEVCDVRDAHTKPEICPRWLPANHIEESERWLY